MKSNHMQKTKDLLIEAAVRMFHEKGFNQVGVREIAAAAGVTTGSFYHHFKGKDEVMHGIYTGRDQLFGQRLKKLADNPPYCERILDFFLQDMTNIVESDGVDLTAHRMFNMKVKSSEGTELYKGIKHLVRLAQENNELSKDDDPEQITWYLFVVFRGILYDWCISSDSSEQKPLKDLMELGMRAALRAFSVSGLK